MKVLEEITQWDVEYDIPNHVYFVNDSKDKMYAYLPSNTKQVTEFKIPIRFSTSKRKFREIENTFAYQMPEDRPVGRTWQITGSKGDAYTVAHSAGVWSCTCSGFRFRNQCRHISQVAQSQE